MPAAARTARPPRPRGRPSASSPAAAGRGALGEDSGAIPVRNRLRGRARLRAGVAGQRPRQGQLLAGTRDGDVEQPPLLLDRVGPRQRLRDRHDAVDEPDDEDGVPLQALGRVHRGEGHPLHGRGVLGVGPLGQVRRRSRRGPASGSRRPGRRRGRPAPPATASGRGPRRRAAGRCSAQPVEARTSRTVGTSAPGSLPPAAAPRSSRTASRISGRSKKRSPPLSTYGTPTSVSAAS